MIRTLFAYLRRRLAVMRDRRRIARWRRERLVVSVGNRRMK
jgi:hypothetical protein